MEFAGLIADGVYTIWHFLSANQAGALASHPDEINNVFVADAAGSVSASVVGTPGPMTFSGTAPACQLPVPPGEAVRFGVHMVMLYHTDNQSWGPRSGPEETVIAHLFVMGE